MSVSDGVDLGRSALTGRPDGTASEPRRSRVDDLAAGRVLVELADGDDALDLVDEVVRVEFEERSTEALQA